MSKDMNLVDSKKASGWRVCKPGLISDHKYKASDEAKILDTARVRSSVVNLNTTNGLQQRVCVH